ncbi:MAG: DotU family type IV/VI secretion system protein, partial [Desulfuromonadales bacterium]|nr:DotU family type IV/VI secretion system protein [Desulfuromonadales bacterium]
YVAYFKQNAATRQPPFEQVKGDIQRLLSESEAYVKKGAFSQEDYDQARFMVCAWVDEAILSSSWSQKGSWQREQLQRLYYNTTDAGEEVFERLNALGFHQQDVREVFYLCLALGFKGRFIHQGDEFLLEQLKLSNLKFLMGSSVGIPSLDRAELFPEAYPAHSVEIAPQRSKFRFSLVTISALVGPLVLIGVLYLIYHFTLNGIADNFFRAG